VRARGGDGGGKIPGTPSSKGEREKKGRIVWCREFPKLREGGKVGGGPDRGFE